MNTNNYEILFLGTDTTPVASKQLRKTGNVQGTISEIVETARIDFIEYVQQLPTPKTEFTEGRFYTRRNQQDKLCAVIYFMIAKDKKQIGYTVGISTLSEGIAFSKRESNKYPFRQSASMPWVMPASKKKQ